MEIEAKFAVPDAKILRRLKTVKRLDDFTLAAGQTKQVHDTYLDTDDRAILAAGYACRQRIQAEGILVTLKSLGGAEGAVHRREELEILLPEAHPPAEWPESPARERLLQLVGKAQLVPLFELRQTRTIRPLHRNRQLVAEMSVDEVRLTVRDEKKGYFELEVELTPQGAESHLAEIAAHLQDEWSLKPEPRSKFERALELLDAPVREPSLMTPQERAACTHIAARDDMYGRRARALLALDEGLTQPEAGGQADLSERRARYWLAAFREKRMDVFPARVLIETEPAPKPVKKPPRQKIPKPPEKPGLEANDTMAEAARKTLYFHFLRMLYHEPGTRLGDDIEELHDMRVATRRMRAAFQVFGGYLDMDKMRVFLKGLKRTGRTLGAVRDLDVFWEKTQHYLDTLPPERQSELEPLRVVWEAERERDRAKMVAYLDSARYVQFKEKFGEFLQTPGAGELPPFSETGEPAPHRLRHVVPVLVYQRLAAVRAYGEWVTGENVPLERLHQLRIASKGLRYTLEYFQEILGAEAKDAIKEIKGLQDHLGNLQDAVVASNLLRDFMTWGTWGHTQAKEGVTLPSEPIVAPGVAVYLAARQVELQQLVDAFPQTWERIQSADFGRLVAAALSPL
ncbi:MAG: CHAD domain-containing protein [Anaerolineae bacterium]|nr:CHAD domain-containing protein [Anaerolineae bacterium]